MTIPQLSIFIENRSGTLIKVLELMKQSRIQMIACTIADTAEYGIFRIICSEPERACRELKEAGVAVALSDVFAIELDDQPGGAQTSYAYSATQPSASPTCMPSSTRAKASWYSVPTRKKKPARPLWLTGSIILPSRIWLSYILFFVSCPAPVPLYLLWAPLKR